jgi:hypothetical protein
MNPLSLRPQPLQRVTATLFSLLCKSERVAGRANVLLLHKLDLVLRGGDVFLFLLLGSKLAIAVRPVYHTSQYMFREVHTSALTTTRDLPVTRGSVSTALSAVIAATAAVAAGLRLSIWGIAEESTSVTALSAVIPAPTAISARLLSGWLLLSLRRIPEESASTCIRIHSVLRGSSSEAAVAPVEVRK